MKMIIGGEWVDFEQAESDFITTPTNLMRETQHLIGAPNSSRG
jgi:phosphoglycerate dehydrogenase-like enzyme